MCSLQMVNRVDEIAVLVRTARIALLKCHAELLYMMLKLESSCVMLPKMVK